jgi:hypothetical protein
LRAENHADNVRLRRIFVKAAGHCTFTNAEQATARPSRWGTARFTDPDPGRSLSGGIQWA